MTLPPTNLAQRRALAKALLAEIKPLPRGFASVYAYSREQEIRRDRLERFIFAGPEIRNALWAEIKERETFTYKHLEICGLA